MRRIRLPALAAALLCGAGFLATAGDQPRARAPVLPALPEAPSLAWFPRPAAFAPEAATRLFAGPAPLPAPAAEIETPAEAEVAEAAAPKLLGTFVSGPRRSALIRLGAAARPRWLVIGDAVGGGTIVAIDAGRVMLSDAQVLALKRPGEAEESR